jgi:hypothetical protein
VSARYLGDVVSRTGALPGVTAVGLISRLPVRDGGYQGVVSVEGRRDLDGPNRPTALYRKASPGFFGAMGMRVVTGREIDIRCPYQCGSGGCRIARARPLTRSSWRQV